MPHHFSQHSSMAGSSMAPPAYYSERRYSEDQEFMADEVVHRPRSKAPGTLMPFAADSSRAIANGGLYAADRNAHLPPDTPSAYSDQNEYNSTVVGDGYFNRAGSANILSTRPDPQFLSNDPYSKVQAVRPKFERTESMGTIGPGDSVSAVNFHAISRNLSENVPDQGVSHDLDYEADPYTYSVNHGGNEAQDFYDTSYAIHYPYEMSTDDVPLQKYPVGMGYAEDEDQEFKQRDPYWSGYSQEKWEPTSAPSLFANNLQGAAPSTKGLEEGGEDRKGLLARFGNSSKGGLKPGWGGTLEEQIGRRRRAIGRQRWPILTWLLTLAYVVVFIIELILGKQQTGQAIQTTPSWNPMLGPSFEFLISFGARFVPCMRNIPQIPTTTELACLQYSTASTLTSSELCPIWELCGLPNAETTNQAYRFITPMFIHAGFIHIAFNLMVQLTLCAQIEKLISTPFYAIIYFAGGVGGNLLGANFGLVGQPSVGASGAIYTCISVELIDLCYNWKYEYKPKTRLVVSIIFAIVGFAIGLLPGLDNFAHIGGFAVGTLGGLLFCPSIHATKRHRIITWVLRVISAALLVGFFVGLSTNFYSTDDPTKACPWCRYLSCLPTFSQCQGDGLITTTTSSSSSS